MEKEKVWICVFRDTVEELEDDWQTNLSEILVTEDFARQYFEECCAEQYDESIDFENWIMNYDASETTDFYNYASKHNAVIDIEHWK